MVVLSVCRHFSEFLRSHHFCKYQIEVLTSGTVYLADILFCESALFYFSEVSVRLCFVSIIPFYQMEKAINSLMALIDTSDITKKMRSVFFLEKMH